MEHGVSNGRDKPGGWAPAAGPGPEGWYEDPWNAKFQRFWDGKQWSGKTAPAGTHPDGTGNGAASTDAARSAPASEPGPTARSGAALLAQARASRPTPVRAPVPPAWNGIDDEEVPKKKKLTDRASPRTLIAGATAGGLLLIGIVVLLAVGGVGGSGDPSPLPVVPAVGPGQTRLAGGVAGQADLGLGWTPYPPAHALTPNIFKVGPCGSGLWSGDVGGYEDSFINGNKATAAHGAVVSQVREAADVASADKQRQFVLSPSYIPCLKQTVATEVSSQFPPNSGERVGDITVRPLDIHLPIDSQAFILTASVIESNGAAGPTITNEAVQLFSGPYSATIDVSWCSCAPLTQQVVEKVATAVSLRIAALPPQGTGPPPPAQPGA
ncbi:MAG: hypothetical protein NVS3B21_24730 [Acidimicrobiales bacterium]